jgi:signal peptidase II
MKDASKGRLFYATGTNFVTFVFMKKSDFALPLFILISILAIDQWVKYYIKTHFYLGEEINVAGDWFRIHFTENYGMAFGMEFGGKTGKLLLTFFRIAAIGFIVWYLFSLIQKQTSKAYLTSWTLILAGAIGNLIDSIFYGVWFGYDTWFHGRVVDMLYFPIIQTTIPEGFPIWGGHYFEFFSPVFNIADASISLGFILILLFQRSYLENESNQTKEVTE